MGTTTKVLKVNQTHELDRKAFRFMEDVQDIITQEHSLEVSPTSDGTRLKEADITTEMPLNGNRILLLMNLVKRHNFNSIVVKPSATGLLIQYSI